MKTEHYTCDICGNPTSAGRIADALLTVCGDTHKFHVCESCWVTTPKGVFQKAYNAICRALGKKK